MTFGTALGAILIGLAIGAIAWVVHGIGRREGRREREAEIEHLRQMFNLQAVKVPSLGTGSYYLELLDSVCPAGMTTEQLLAGLVAAERCRRQRGAA